MHPSEQRRVDDMAGLMRVKPGSSVRLPHDFDPGFRGGYADQKDAEAVLAKDIAQLSALQDRLAAQTRMRS